MKHRAGGGILQERKSVVINQKGKSEKRQSGTEEKFVRGPDVGKKGWGEHGMCFSSFA